MNSIEFHQHKSANHHQPQSIATAPEVPSSANLNFYDPRTSYYTSTEHPVPMPPSYAHSKRQSQSQSMHSVASASTSIDTTDELSNQNSLPPLSDLLISKENQSKSTSVDAKNSNRLIENGTPSHINTEISQALGSHYHSPSVPEQNMHASMSTTATIHPDMLNNVVQLPSRSFVPQPHSTPFSVTSPPVPSQSPLLEPSPAHYRKHPITAYPATDHAGRFYMLPTHSADYRGYQQQQHSSSNYIVPSSSELTLLPTASNAHHDSTTTSIYAQPTPNPVMPNSLSVNTMPNRQFYPLPSPPTSVIDGMLMTADPNHPFTNVPFSHSPALPMASTAHTNQNNQKVFSFVPLPGPNQKKRPRRKFHEVERLYKCNYLDCKKAYGTLNHLNAHVSMQRHGPKRQPSEFKELRKIWRQQKKEHKQRFNEANKIFNKEGGKNVVSGISSATAINPQSSYSQSQFLDNATTMATSAASAAAPNSQFMATPNTSALHHHHHFTHKHPMLNYMQHHHSPFHVPPPPPPPPPPPSLPSHWVSSRLPAYTQHTTSLPPPSPRFVSHGY